MTPYFDDATVQRLLDPEKLLAETERALIALSRGDVRQPMRSVMEVDPESVPANDRTLLMCKPARIDDLLVTKLVTVAPRNSAANLPTILATVVLMDARTGQTLATMDGTWLTNLRTAAVSAVGARLLTPSDASVVAMIGSGALSRTHAQMLRLVRPVSQIRVFSPNKSNAMACAAQIDGQFFESAQAATEGADIVCTLTTATEPVVSGSWLKPGAMVAAVGAPRPTWRELDDEAMRHYVIADSRESALKEAGDVIGAGATVRAEIGELLADASLLPPAGTTTIFKALGQAVEDAVAANLVYVAARSEGLVT